MKKALFSCLFSSLLFAQTPLDYLNTLRTQTGLNTLVENGNLTQAATNHTDYMRQNNIVGHYESSSNAGYTGVHPYDRAIYANYQSRYVRENVSAGQPSAQASIDGDTAPNSV